jgi:transposase
MRLGEGAAISTSPKTSPWGGHGDHPQAVTHFPVSLEGCTPRRRSRDGRDHRGRTVCRGARCVQLHLCRATWTQQVPDWLASHERAFAFFGGVTAAIVCDQLKSGVVVPCRYEPGLQRTYEEFAQHYGAAILPARPGKAQDKAKVEVAVQVVERWILARLRHETFFSLAALNTRIRELLTEFNARRMRRYQASRLELFARLDQPALRPLPPEPFIYGEWKTARVNIDYHVELAGHYYSVPPRLVARPGRRARRRHPRRDLSPGPPRRRPPAQSRARHAHDRGGAHAQGPPGTSPVDPSRLIAWAGTVGPQTAALVEAILADRPHPEQGYRSCLGILRLAKRYGPGRVEAAAARAVTVGARSYRHVDSILKHGLDRVALPTAAAPLPLAPAHEHLRGRDYYQ